MQFVAYLEVEVKAQGAETLTTAIGFRAAMSDVLQDAFGKKKGVALKLFGDVVTGEGQSDGATAGDSQEMSELRRRFSSLGVGVEE